MVPSFPSATSALSQRRALLAAAHAGDPESQSQLADIYRVGDELTAQDLDEALKWYRRAADHDEASAQNNLGSMYLNGMGVRRDAAEATRWFRKAAGQGLSPAQFNLALRYLHGDGVEQDGRAAVPWLLKAAEQGHVEAIGQLASCFRFALGVERNVAIAARLLVKTAMMDDVVSMGNLTDYREEIEREALAGSLRAALALARMYSDGLGVEEDAAVAYAWLLWGMRFGVRDDDQAARDELYEHWLVVYSERSRGDEDRAYALLEQMRRRQP